MGRQTFVKNYNSLRGGVVTDLSKLAASPENAVKDALNFEFTLASGANRRKALDLESGITGSDYTQLNSDRALGVSKQQAFTFKSVIDAFGTTTHDIVYNTFDNKGIVYKLGEDQQLADSVKDASVAELSGSINMDTWYGVAWSPKLGLFVAVAADVSPTDPIVVSSDGVNWVPTSSITGTDSAGSITAVVWSAELELFIAKSTLGDYSSLTSSDGFNWHWREFNASSYGYNPRDVAWAAEIGVLASVGEDPLILGDAAAYSTDGLSWNTATINTARDWQAIAWSPELGLFAAVADSDFLVSGQYATTSPDGQTWTLRTTPATDRAWKSIAWSPENAKFVAVGNTAGYVLTSTDGVSWTEVANMSASSFNDVVWVSELGLFVAVGNDVIQTSTDGTTWTTRTTAAANNWKALVWSPELSLLVAVSLTGTNRVMTSTDGITWTSVDPVASQGDVPQEWIKLQGLPIGTKGLPELQVLYNEDDTTYKIASTVPGLMGPGPTIRDFTGVTDGLEAADTPSVLTFLVGGITGTFVEGEDILVTLTGSGVVDRMFRIVDKRGTGTWGVDKSLLDSHLTAFDGADTTELQGLVVTGQTSAATGTISAGGATEVGLSDAHRYNLINQGWTQTHMDTYAKSKDVWPSNSQTWYSGRDSSNNFSPTELDKIGFGNSEAPKGHVLLNPFREWRHTKVPGVWNGALPELTYSRGFTTIAAFGSRVAMSGGNIGGAENIVYISPVLFNKLVTADDSAFSDVDLSEVFKFYQKNDPTADIGNELLPDDGVVIPIAAANRVYKVVELQNAVLVFADNGVWAISGLDAQSGFTTDSFSVIKVSGAPGTTNGRSVVSTSESVYYMAADGIYAINYSSEGAFTAANITINRIGVIYEGIIPAVREAAISYYDEYNQKIYWAYNGEATPTYPEFRNKLLVLDLVLNAFYPLKMPQTLSDGVNLSAYLMSINGFTQDPAYPNSDGTIPLKLLVTEINSSTSTDMKHTVMEFNNAGTNFNDYDLYRTDVHSDSDGTIDEEAFLETWDDTLGDTSRSKQAIWVLIHMTKTEYGFEDLGGGALGALGQSSLTMVSKWDWNVSSSGGKWGTAREIYRHLRPYVPVDVNDTFDSGESVLTTKNKIYGRGRALSLRFDAVANKDAILLGYSIPYSVENNS